jgi:NADH:ubiquinone oxidoreductase subunit 6 (subunit J)
MSPDNSVRLVVVVLAVVIVFVVHALARRSLLELLSRTVSVAGGTEFYLRSFLLVLLFGAVGQAIAVNPNLKNNASFMECVWAVADGLQTSFGYLFASIAIYLVLMTILVAALKHKNDK